MNDLQIDGIKTDENAAMVLLVDDQAMIGEAVRRGLAHEEYIDFHFCAEDFGLGRVDVALLRRRALLVALAAVAMVPPACAAPQPPLVLAAASLQVSF